jgi:hypothetical protein
MLEEDFMPDLGGVASGVGKPVSATFLAGPGSFLLAGLNCCCSRGTTGTAGAEFDFLWRRYFDGVAGRAWSLAAVLARSFFFLPAATLTLSWAFSAFNLFFLAVASSKRKQNSSLSDV